MFIMENNFKVYIHRNLINNKVYIGQTRNSLKSRCGVGGKNYKSNLQFWNDIEKYGWDNFEHKILYDGLKVEEANKIERDLIKQYNSNDDKFGYNIVRGGGNIQIDESKYQHEVTIEGTTIVKKTKTRNSQRKAIKEYEQKFEQVKIRLPQGSRDKINKYLSESKKYASVNAMLKALIENEIGHSLDLS